MQDLSWSLHHKQLYSHRNPPKNLPTFCFSTLNLLNKPRAFCHFIYTYIYIYFDFFSYMPSFLNCLVLSVFLSRNLCMTKIIQIKESTAWTYRMKRTYAHTHSHDIHTVWKETFSHELSEPVVCSKSSWHTHLIIFFFFGLVTVLYPSNEKTPPHLSPPSLNRVGRSQSPNKRRLPIGSSPSATVIWHIEQLLSNTLG